MSLCEGSWVWNIGSVTAIGRNWVLAWSRPLFIWQQKILMVWELQTKSAPTNYYWPKYLTTRKKLMLTQIFDKKNRNYYWPKYLRTRKKTIIDPHIRRTQGYQDTASIDALQSSLKDFLRNCRKTSQTGGTERPRIRQGKVSGNHKSPWWAKTLPTGSTERPFRFLDLEEFKISSGDRCEEIWILPCFCL